MSDAAYDLFSPPSFDYHILLRKVESVVAFFVVGYVLDRAILEDGRAWRFGTATALVAVFSAALEVAQKYHGSQEGFVWNAIDTICGAAGGFLADLAVAAQRRSARAARTSRLPEER